MTSKRSIFFDEWQACLRAHYVHVIRTNDSVTERTLRAVLQQSGLTDADLRALVEEALDLGPVDPEAEITLVLDSAAAYPAEEAADSIDLSGDEDDAGDTVLTPDDAALDDDPEPFAAVLPADDDEYEDAPPTDTDEMDDTDQPPSPLQLSLF